MILKKLSIRFFRNIAQAEIVPGARFNFIVGKNGQGKTNLLESIYLLGTIKSFRLAKNPELICYGSACSSVRGLVERDGVLRDISLSIEPSGKRVRIDNKTATRLSDFFGCINMVVFSPEDIAMVRGGPDSRRRYLDRAIFSADMGYLAIHHEYFRTLKNRNALLKRGEGAGLDTWTEKLALAGAGLIMKRIAYTREISQLLSQFYGKISGCGDMALTRYRHGLLSDEESSPSVEDLRLALLDRFTRNSAEEWRRGMTMTGPHRDDLEFFLNGRLLRQHGSQGEQRSFVLALKMAEIEYIRRRYGSPPVLLLDDMTSELDGDRNRNFMGFLREKEMQVFITTTSLDNITLTGIENYSVFPIMDGKVMQ